MSHPAKLPANDLSSFVQGLSGISIAALVALGAGGSLYKLLTPEGWIGQVFGRSVAAGLALLLALLMIGISAWLLRAWISTAQRNLYSELMVYVFAGLGLVYAVEILIQGGA